MGLLTRAIIAATLTVALIAAFAAATVTVNTPTGPLFIGAQYFIRWTISGSTPTSLGIVNVHNKENNNVTTIDQNVNFTSGSLPWTVNVVAGTYYFGINDGSGENDSGEFQVIDRGSGSTGTAPAPSGNTPDATHQGTTAPAATTGAPAATTGAGSNPTTSKSGASTMRSNLLGLFVGLGVVALAMIQLF